MPVVPEPEAPPQAPTFAEAAVGKPSPKSGLDVYLVPIGRERYECYYEAVEEEEAVELGVGFFARLRHRFHEQLKEAERSRHQAAIQEPKTLLGRMHRRSLRWIAERIAEQRLLWHLRPAKAATLHVPADLPAGRAESIMRDSMKRDADRHRNRLIPHTLALIASGLVAIVPGPNMLAYLFTFTVVGHFLSWRGAANALNGVAWTMAPNAALAEIQCAFSLAPDDRHRVILDVAERMHLPRLARFVERMATPTT